MKTTIIGHRGAMGRELENSLASFNRAFEMGSDMIELDARTTIDGHVIVMHDETLDRTTNGQGTMSRMMFDDIRKFKLRNSEEIPTLAEVLEIVGKHQVNIELKDMESAIPSGKIVKDMGLQSNVLFSSFSGPWLLSLKNKYPWARIAFACRDRDIEMVHIAQTLMAEAVHPAMKLTTPNLVEKAHDGGLKVNVWTVNSSWQMKKFIRMGVDGIITNRPDVLVEVLKKVTP